MLNFLKRLFWLFDGPEEQTLDPETLVKRLYPKAKCHLEVEKNIPGSQYCCWCVYLDGHYKRFACWSHKKGAWRYALEKLQED